MISGVVKAVSPQDVRDAYLHMEMHVTPAKSILEAAFSNNCCLQNVHEEFGAPSVHDKHFHVHEIAVVSKLGIGGAGINPVLGNPLVVGR